MVLRSVYFMVKFHFNLRTVIGIDSLYWFLKKCCFQLYKCSNSCLWCSCWWNLNFSFKSYGKESLYKYCMNVDDGRIMRSWRSCLLVNVFIQEHYIALISVTRINYIMSCVLVYCSYVQLSNLIANLLNSSYIISLRKQHITSVTQEGEVSHMASIHVRF